MVERQGWWAREAAVMGKMEDERTEWEETESEQGERKRRWKKDEEEIVDQMKKKEDEKKLEGK